MALPIRKPDPQQIRTTYYGRTCARNFPLKSSDSTICTIYENFTVDEISMYAESRWRPLPAVEELIKLYRPKRLFPDLSDFRLGPNKIDDIPLDWIVIGQDSNLVGHGITTRIPWDGNVQNLPQGWQGTVRRGYENLIGPRLKCNTVVGLFIRLEDEFQEHGWAGKIIDIMRELSRQAGAEHLIIPLRLPKRYTRQYADMPFSDFVELRREDGQYVDHWLRLHVRLGARVIGTNNGSHRYALSLQDFRSQFVSEPMTRSGYTIAEKQNEFFRVYVDLEHDFALINQECVWVEHQINAHKL